MPLGNRRLSWLLFLFLVATGGAAALGGCDGCAETPAGGDGGIAVGIGDGGGGALACEDDGDCRSGERCVSGICKDVDGDAGPGGPSGDDAGPSGPLDAGPEPAGHLEALPGDTLEFGAQLLGVPVTREVTLRNAGDAPLSILALILDDDSGEFSAEPNGTVNERLEPGDALLVQVSHTPEDGVPDSAELKVLHDGPGNLLSVALFAEFKGDAALSVSDDLAVTSPNTETLDFGQLDPGTVASRTLWIRNTGRSDSILTISDVTLTPPSAGFALLDELDLPVSIGAWSAALCEDDASGCPPGATACTDGVCTDEDGLPLHAVPVDIAFTAGELSSAATLTLEHDAAGVPGTQTDVQLLGGPTEPALAMSPAELDFGLALVGAPAPSRTLTLENTGEGPLRIRRVTEPAEPAFSFEYSRPVPRIDGDPALTILPGGDPLVITVSFTPTSAQAYASFLQIRTNDPSALDIPVPIRGAGLVCQANAHVNAQGACECDPGFNACGDACLADGPDACGPSCTVCESRPGTERACMAGQCEYACTEQRYDLNDDVDDGQGTGSDGCEYLCPRDVPRSELCNSVDDDCDGIADNGLPADTKEPNNTCNARATLTQVNTGGTSQFSTYTLYPLGDDDWFQIRVAEADDDICVPCIDPDSCEDYTTSFELIDQPNGQDYVLEVRHAASGCGSTSLTTTNGGKKVVHQWRACANTNGDGWQEFLCGIQAVGFPIAGEYGGCGFNDVRDYIVRVRPRNGSQAVQSCETYTLQVSHQ